MKLASVSFQLFQLLTEAGDTSAVGFSSFAADVASIKKAKLPQNKNLSADVANRFSHGSDEMLLMGVGPGFFLLQPQM